MNTEQEIESLKKKFRKCPKCTGDGVYMALEGGMRGGMDVKRKCPDCNGFGYIETAFNKTNPEDQLTIERLEKRIQQLHRERNTLTQETDKAQLIVRKIKKALYRSEKNHCWILPDGQVQSSIILSQFIKGKER